MSSGKSVWFFFVYYNFFNMLLLKVLSPARQQHMPSRTSFLLCFLALRSAQVQLRFFSGFLRRLFLTDHNLFWLVCACWVASTRVWLSVFLWSLLNIAPSLFSFKSFTMRCGCPACLNGRKIERIVLLYCPVCPWELGSTGCDKPSIFGKQGSYKPLSAVFPLLLWWWLLPQGPDGYCSWNSRCLFCASTVQNILPVLHLPIVCY